MSSLLQIVFYITSPEPGRHLQCLAIGSSQYAQSSALHVAIKIILLGSL